MNRTNRLKITRKRRVRAKLSSNRPRLSVYRSNKSIYAQIINDSKGETLVAASSHELKKDKKTKLTKIEQAHAVGELIAQKAKDKKIKKVSFDRGPYKFHGRVKALAESSKKQGLIF